MKMLSITRAATWLLTAMVVSQVWAEELYAYRMRREAVDWCTITIRTRPANSPERPLVLLIGDSITVRYAAEVNTALREKAYVSVLGTSKAVGDPALLDEIKLVLRQNVYAVIHFNYGLHGGLEGYRKGFSEVVATLKHYAPGAKLIWGTTTPCQQKDGGPDQGVLEKNQIAAPHLAREDIAVDDLYTLIANHPVTLWDGGGVHYTAAGTALQSKQVVQAIVQWLPKPSDP